MTPRESDYDQTIVDMSHAYGWRCVHFRPAMTAKGYRTPVSGDGKGWPDWIFARIGSPLLIIEGKSAKGKVTKEQDEWIELLGEIAIATKGMIVKVFYWPDDLDRLEELLGA